MSNIQKTNKNQISCTRKR